MNWARLAEHLGAIPDLDGAACKGNPARFDQPDPPQDPRARARLAAAAAECRRCPVLTACGRWVDGLPARQRPAGIVAGRLFIADQGRNVERRIA
jgi:hypothetical protein